MNPARLESLLADWRRRLPCGSIVELGPSGVHPGHLLLHASPDYDLTGAGFTPAQQERARKTVRAKGWGDRAVYLAESAPDDLPLESRSADAVVAFGALQTWDRPGRVFDEIARILKTGGLVWLGDVRAEAGWLPRWAGRLAAPGWAEVYQRPARWLTPDLAEQLDHSLLSQGRLECSGPDLWIVSR